MWYNIKSPREPCLLRPKVTVGLHYVFCWEAKDPVDDRKFENVGGEDCPLYICVDVVRSP